jgi:xanthine dehydrogenase accessory factor
MPRTVGCVFAAGQWCKEVASRARARSVRIELVNLTDAQVFQEAARRASAREPFVLCTVTATDRSAPRDAGAKMLVAPDGTIAGTVGGGPLEAVVIQEARARLRDGGGSAERRFMLTTTGDAAHPIPGPSEELGMKCGGEVSVFLDVVRPSARLLLYGAGHVGERVARVACEVGLEVTIVDDRPPFADRKRFPNAAEVRCVDLVTDPLGGVAPDGGDFVVILTRCHALDEGVLEAALTSNARYIGLIGSRRKVAVILRSIARRTGRDPRGDDRLHAPIGLKLGDKTPGEIAISILAEILLLKSNGALAHSRLPHKTVDTVRAFK